MRYQGILIPKASWYHDFRGWQGGKDYHLLNLPLSITHCVCLVCIVCITRPPCPARARRPPRRPGHLGFVPHVRRAAWCVGMMGRRVILAAWHLLTWLTMRTWCVALSLVA